MTKVLIGNMFESPAMAPLKANRIKNSIPLGLPYWKSFTNWKGNNMQIPLVEQFFKRRSKMKKYQAIENLFLSFAGGGKNRTRLRFPSDLILSEKSIRRTYEI